MSVASLKVAFVLLQLIFLVLASVFAVIAARGYRGTPWGRVLRPLPAVTILMALGASVTLLPFTPIHGGIYTTTLFGFALIGIVYATVQFVRVISRGQQVER